MFLTDEQARARLNSEKNLANRFNRTQVSEPVRAPCFHPEVSFHSESDIVPDRQVPDRQAPQSLISIDERTILSSGKNRANLSREERTEIAIETRSGSTCIEVARNHGITAVNAQKIKNADTKGIDEERVKKTLDTVRDRALERLMQSLGLLTEDKLSGCSAKDLSVIASNMGRVVEKIQTKETQPDNINFIIYAPELKQEKSFDMVEI